MAFMAERVGKPLFAPTAPCAQRATLCLCVSANMCTSKA
jgi:hypothetical protein